MIGTWAAVLAAATLLLLGPVRRSARASRLAGTGRLAAPPAPAPERPRGARAIPRRGYALGFAALGVAVAFAAGFVLAVPAGVLGALGLLLGRDVRARRQEAARRRAVGTALRVLVGELEAGAQPAAALSAAAEAVPALADPFAAAAEVAAAGEDAGAVLAAQADPQLQAIGAAWRLSAATGAALASVLARIAADLAAVEEQRRTVAGALAGPRSSALVLALLPGLGVLLGAGMGAHPLQFLLQVRAGRLLCCAGVVLDAVGVLWMRALLRRAEQA